MARALVIVVLLAVVLAWQATLAPRLTLLGAQPDGVLVVVVFFALHLPAAQATTTAWCAGLATDLLSAELPGLCALAYLLVALLVAAERDYFFRYSAAAQFALTLLVALMVRGAWLMYRHALYDPARGFLSDAMIEVLWGAVYTAAWAPLVHAGLIRLGGAIGLTPPRYSHAGLRRQSG